MKTYIILLFTLFFSVGAYAQKTASLWVNGACGMCSDRIETAALQIMGVEKATHNLETKILTIEYNEPFFVEDLHTHLASVGHDTEVALANDDTYDNLPACCYYRDENAVESSISEDLMNKIYGPKSEDHDNDVHGMVSQITKTGVREFIVGASVYWVGTQNGVITDEEGYFELDKIEETNLLVIRYIGYEPDTIDMTGQHVVELSLNNNYILDEVSITHKKKSTEISFINTMKVQNIDEKELLKAACCSLSESFETTPSVDVSFTDAVTGTRKIELLGLAGPYVQIMRENMPYIRGLSSIYGLSYTPGPWIESMQLNMGSGSVVNGPESMSGQINLEIKKPCSSERLFVNAYANQFQRFELNINASHAISDTWSTGILLHGSNQNLQQDRQGDGFLDAPLSRQFVAMNRWKYTGTNGLRTQIGVKATLFNKLSGQLLSLSENPNDLWQGDVGTEKWEAWVKIGKIFPDNPQRSLGFQVNATNHRQEATFGRRPYNGLQQSFYSNLIYQNVIPNSDQKFRFGASFQYDYFDELVGLSTYQRTEWMPGVFGEYGNTIAEKLNFIAGIRADYHNLYGFFVTPRIHAKYSPTETTALRIVGGRGQRTASIFAENLGIFASNRVFQIDADENGLPYGLDAEISWNSGINFTKEWIIAKRALVFSTDYYYTFFENQVLVDYDANSLEVQFYNVENASYSHSFQAQVDYELFTNFDVRVAYRYNHVRSQYLHGWDFKPLTSWNRAFVNLAYEFPKRWNVDLTVNYQGRKRIPNMADNPVSLLEEYSPSFVTINGQVSKFFKNGIEMYLGAENLGNFYQENPIIDAENPFSEYFDGSVAWGPIMGRNIYLGVRYRLY